MKIAVIGSGNVATHLVKALSSIESIELQIWSRNFDTAHLLAKEYKSIALESLSQIDKDSNFVIIAIKDDAISDIANQLSFNFKAKPGYDNTIVLHTSGSIPMSVFDEDFKHYGVFYPLQTFSKYKSLNFSEVPLILEGNSDNTLNAIIGLAESLVEKHWCLDSEKRKVLHLAAVFACNFTNHLYALSQNLLKNSDLSFEILKPLILETADKIISSNPVDVQTGPAIRNDIITMKKHEEMLASEHDMLVIYQILSQSIKNTKK